MRLTVPTACALVTCLIISCGVDPNGQSGGEPAPCDIDLDCDDGLFCNGAEMCLDGKCRSGPGPCGDKRLVTETNRFPADSTEECDEEQDTCVTTISQIQSSTWLVLWGDATSFGFATAFGLSPRKLATNAHVTEGIREFFETHAEAVAGVVQHETGEVRNITKVWSHPQYQGDSIVATPDVGIIEVDDLIPAYLDLADDEQLQAIAVFDEVSLCGFPANVTVGLDVMDLVVTGGDFRPRTTCLNGTVSALRPFDPSDPASPANTDLIQYDLPVVEGTSGSAVFNERGHVVGVNSFGFTTGGEYHFAIRSNKLAELVSDVDGGMPGILLENVRLARCQTDFYDDYLQFGFDLSPFYEGPFDFTADFPGAYIVLSFFITDYVWIDAQIWPTEGYVSLDEYMPDWIARSEQSGFILLEYAPFVTPNGLEAYFLQWTSPSEQGFQDLYAIEAVTFGPWGAQVVTGYVYELDLPSYAAVLEASARSICTD